MLNERITEDAEKEREKIEAERQAKIDALPEIPKNISPEKRAKLMEERKSEIAAIREDTSKSKADVSETSKSGRKTNSEDASKQRKQLSTHLKKVVTAARDAYKQARTKIDADYEKISQQEYDKIMTNIPGKKTKRRK